MLLKYPIKDLLLRKRCATSGLSITSITLDSRLRTDLKALFWGNESN